MSRFAIAGVTVTAALAIGVTAAIVIGSSSTTTPTAETIPQPALGEMSKLPLAPDAQRVDLVLPSFSNPTEITNPLFPISDIHSSLLLGKVDGKPLRVEITLMPETRTVEWNGRQIETLESQFVAYLDGRIHEVATDLYAQADDGSVWYFGEDVFNYEDGRVADTEGTWLAGRGSPPTMIMPGSPRVGDVYRAENLPGVVFEQVTVKEVGKTVTGPTGEIDGAMVGEELHMEGDLENKTFAPGYGEFFSGYQEKENYEANALTVPADALDETRPVELTALARSADAAYAAARAQTWKAAAASSAELRVTYESLRQRGVPALLGDQLQEAIDDLEQGVRARDSRVAAQRALAVASAGLDIELRYRQRVEIDLRRFELIARQLVLDAAARDAAAVAGDIATLRWIGERLPLDAADARQVFAELRYLTAAAEADELDLVGTFAERLRTTSAGLEPQA